MSNWLTLDEVLSIIHRSVNTVERWRYEGKLEAKKELRTVESVSSKGKLFTKKQNIWVCSPVFILRMKG